jgi:hypothetical protein
MAHSKMVVAVAFVAALGLTACGGDNSELFPPGTQETEEGAAGAAGGSNFKPPTTGGAGGSAGETFNPPAGGAGGEQATGGSGGYSPDCKPGLGCEPDGVTCYQDWNMVLGCYCGIWTTPEMREHMECGTPATGGAAGAAGSTGGSGGTSEVTPPDAGTAGTAGTGGTSSTGGAGGAETGGSGGSETLPPDAGTAGTGGSTGGTGGFAGTGGTSGSGGTAGTGGSTGGMGGTSSTGGAGGATGAGELELTIVPATSGQHVIKAFVQTLSYLPGEPDWSTEHDATGTRLTFKVTAWPESGFVMNGYYDPEPGKDPWIKSFCNLDAGKPTVAVMAKFNGQPLATPQVVSNDHGGCNLMLFAIPLTANANDADGDGEPVGLDCDDEDAFVHHGAVETPDDQVDYDCDGNVNPLHVVYRLAIGQSSYTPVLYDWTHGGKSYNMAWRSAGYYEVAIEKPIAAREFVIQYSATAWSVGMVSGSCTKTADVTAHLEQLNTQYTVDMVAYTQYNTCHSILTNFQP